MRKALLFILTLFIGFIGLSQGRPIFHYTLAGTTNDETTNAYHITGGVGTWTADRNGKATNAFLSSGTTNYLSLPLVDFLGGRSMMAASLWFNTSDTTTLQYLMNLGNMYVYISSSGGVLAALQVGGVWYSANSGAVTANDWHHVAVSFDGVTLQLYVDNVIYNGGAVSGLISAYPGNSYLASNAAGGSSLNGKLDEVRLYNGPLTQEMVNNLYNNDEMMGHFKVEAANMFDVSGKANYFSQGDGVNSTTYPVLTTDRNGTANNAWSLDGVDDYLVTDLSFESLYAPDSLTFMTWINPVDVLPSPQYIMSSGMASLRLGGQSVTFDVVTTGGTFTLSSNPIQDSTWTSVAAVYDGVNMYLYINGALDASGVAGFSLSPTLGDMKLGTDGVNVNYYRGKMDDFIVYNKALTASEISAIHSTEIPAPANPGISTYTTSASQITISWKNLTDFVDGYRIFRSTDNFNYTLIGDVVAGTNTFDDTGLAANTVYYYYVSAYNGNASTNSSMYPERTFSSAPASQFASFNTYGSSGFDYGRAVAVDAQGNYYFWGVYEDTLTMGATTLVNTNPYTAMFLAKYDASDNLLWARSFMPSVSGYAHELAISPTGGIYLTGTYYGTYSTLPATPYDTLNNQYFQNGFLQKIDSAGNEIWSRTVTMAGYGSMYGVATDNTGGVYVSGDYDGAATFAGFSIPASKGNILYKYDENGVEQWVDYAVQSDLTKIGFHLGLTVDNVNNVYVTGATFGSTTVGNTVGTPVVIGNNGDMDAVLIKYNTNGTVAWATNIGSGAYDEAFDIVTDANGNVYVGGHYYGATLSFVNGTFTNFGQADIFIAKYNASGTNVWGQSYGSEGNDFLFNLETDGGNIYLTGNRDKRTGTFGAVSVENGQYYLASVDTSGNINWVDVAEGNIRGRGMKYANGNLYIPGRYEYVANVGGAYYTSISNSSDVFIGKVSLSVPVTGLVGHYTFDGGSTLDVSGFGYDAVAVNGPLFSMDRYGNYTSSFEPQNNGTYVEVATNGNWNFAGSVTIAGWIRPNSLPDGTNEIWDVIVSGNEFGQFNISSNGTLVYHWLPTGAGTTYSVVETRPGIIPVKQWSHVAMTIDATNNMQLFVNGAAQEISQDGGVFQLSLPITRHEFNPTFLTFSNSSIAATDNRWFDGDIDDVRIYIGQDVAATELQAIYDTEVSGGLDRLVAYLPFNNGTLVDSTQNFYNATYTNSQGQEVSALTMTDRHGSPNGALWFQNNGNSAYVFHERTLNLRENVTVNMWINPSTFATGTEFGDVLFGDNNGGRLMTGRNGSLMYHYPANGAMDYWAITSRDNVISLNQWQMISLTIDTNGNLVIYKDGNPVSASKEGGSYQTINSIADYDMYGLPDRFIIAQKDSVSATDMRYYDGGIDEVSVYQRVLSSEEIYTLYENRLVVYYPFPGNQDYSGNGYHATLFGQVETGDRTNPDVGAYLFNGVDNYVEITSSANLISTGTLTASMWFRTDTVGVFQYLYHSPHAQIYLDDQNYLHFNLSDGVTGSGVSSLTPVSVGEWIHFAGVYNGIDASLYINGLIKSTATLNYTLTTAIGPVTLGEVGQSNFFKGAMDEFRLYNQPLSAADIASLYDYTQPRMVAYFPFNGNAIDETGNGNDLTVNGPTLVPDRFGIPDAAYDFAGFPHYMISPQTFDPNSHFTASVWVNWRDGASQFEEILSWSGNGTGGAAMYLGVDGQQIRFGDLYTTTGVMLPMNTYTHLVAIYDGTSKLYMNGTLVAESIPHNGYLFDSLNVGKQGSLDENFDGIIDDIRLYNYALTGTEVLDMYNSEMPQVPADPSGLRARVVSSTDVELSWVDNAQNETHYQVDWYLGGNFVASSGVLGMDTKALSVQGLQTDSTYTFYVFAINDFGSGVASAVATPVQLSGLAYSIQPTHFTMDDQITITYFPTQSYPVGDLVTASKVYLHSGLVEAGKENQGGWVSAETWGTDNGVGLMTNNGDGTWSISLVPSTYYGVPSFSPSQIGFIFRDETGSNVGQNAHLPTVSTYDYFEDFYQPDSISIPTGGYLDISSTGWLELTDLNATFPSAYTLTGNQLTIEMWVNPHLLNTAGDTKLFRRLDGSTVEPFNFAFTSNQWEFNVTNATGVTGSVYSTSNYGVGNWVHLAGVYDGAALRLYVNGMPAGSTAFSGNLYSALSNATLQLGYGTSEGFYDDVRIWNVARTQDDIRATIEQSLTGSEAGLAGYWKLDGTYDAGGGVFYTPDATSNGNDLLLAGNVNQVILPDLIISSVFLPTTILQAAQQIVIDYTIENIGEGDVNIITSTGFYISLDSMYSLDDYFLGSVGEDSFIPSLDVQTWSVFGDLPVDIADGDHWIIAVADINEVLQESDETNNASPGAKFTVVSDVSSPVVSMVVPPKSERLDFDFSITATDDIGVSEVVLYKKPAGSVSYYTTSLTSSTSTFTGSIFASDFDELGVTLFAIAYDLTGKADTTMIETIITDIPATDFRSFGIQNGNDANAYQIIAFPYESKSTSQVFADFGPIDPSKWRLLGYSGSLPYSSVSSLQAGKGYWLIADNAISQVTFSGVSPVAADEGNPYTMSLKTGWNLIGNPYEFILDWAEVILYNVDNNQLIETDLSSLFAYSAGWYNPGGLNEYMGAFVYAYNDIQLKIPFTSLKNVGAREEMGLTVARENINENGGWEMIMEITAEGNWRYGVAGFGAFDQASDDFDVYDMRTPYMFDHFLKATFQDVETETNGEVSRSIHAINDNDTWTFDVSTHLPQGTLMDITFKGFPALHENERIVLFDLQTGKTVDIANAVNYSFAYKPGYTFKVIKGSPSFVASELNLSQVVVSELYPNPSEGAIHLPVFLPGNEVQYTLEMKITDLAGKQYPILEGVQLSAGSHQLSVDLKPYGLAGGLYVLDVSIGTGTSTPITITQKVYLTE